MKCKHDRGHSDKTLFRLWRKAVLIRWDGRCALCGNDNEDELDCHHIVRRHQRILRFDPRNGVPLCKPRVRSCHRKAETIRGWARLEKAIKARCEDDLEYLEVWEHMRYSDYLRDRGVKDSDVRREERAELEKIISGQVDLFDRPCAGEPRFDSAAR